MSDIKFRPRRGSTNTMVTKKKNIVLEAGEIFIEKPDILTGDNQYKIKIGDGVTTYGNLPYAVDPTNITAGEISFSQTKTLSTTSSTQYSFTDANINSSAAIQVFTTIYGVNPTSVTVSSNTCYVTFPPYTSSTSMTCKIYIKY